MHSHGHHHDSHNHPHSHVNLTAYSRSFVIGIILNLVFVAIEFMYGIWSDSLALMADAGHNFGDVAGLAISLLALKMADIKPTSKFTYGYSKGTILASLANAMLLLIAIGSIGYEAFHRFYNPVQTNWKIVSLVASIGIVINTATALLFLNKNELNSKAAFLHMAADAAVSAAVVLGGFMMKWTGIAAIDPAISILICIVILTGTWRLLKSSMRLSLDGVPDNIDFEKIKSVAMSTAGILDIHHLHIWAMSTTKNALTAHLLVSNELTSDDLHHIKEDLKHKWTHLGIQHATIETETKHTHDCEEC